MDDYIKVKQDLQEKLGRRVDLVMGEAARGRQTRSGKRFIQHFERDKVLIYG